MNEFEVQNQMVKSLKTVTLRLWGRWNGEKTQPRFICNNSMQHQFSDTVEACAEREAKTGYACHFCVELNQEHTVDFDTFSKDAIELNEARKEASQKALKKARRASRSSYSLDRYAM